MKEEVILSRVNFCSSCSLEKENAELLESCRDKDRQLNNWFLSYNEVIKENAELKEKLRVDGQCEACKLGDLIVENAKLKKENMKLRERLNSVNKSNDEYEMMYRKSIDEHNENIQLKAQIENMKNFYNCSHSSRALCPNEHKCNGCKDWELAE